MEKFTGKMVADMLGMGDLYDKSAAYVEEQTQIAENKKKEFNSMMQRMNECNRNYKDVID